MTYCSCAVERIGTGHTRGASASQARLNKVAPRAGKRVHRSGLQGHAVSIGADDARTQVCFYVDSRGRQHFNFPQRVWLYPSVPMAVTPVMSIELQTLAINLLTPLTRRRDYCAAVGVTSKRVVRLASQFCVECLLTAQSQAWVMRRSTIRSWLASRSRIQGHLRPGERSSR